LDVIRQALGKWRTPFYINVREALEGLAPLSSLDIPVRH
jgi:hypothetical protein